MSNKRRESMPLVERSNSLSLEDFQTLYIPAASLSLPPGPCPASEQQGSCYIKLETAKTIPSEELKACFDLIASTSKSDYEQSSIGWSPSKKLREMKLPDLKYLLICTNPKDEGGNEEASNETSAKVTQKRKVHGFASFMVTYEDGYEVVYVYEIHLSKSLRGKGIGKSLFTIMEEVGRGVGLCKIMLTVFVAAKGATGFYERLGFEIDEYSPGPRKLRGGKVKKPDYLILSKKLKDESRAKSLKLMDEHSSIKD